MRQLIPALLAVSLLAGCQTTRMPEPPAQHQFRVQGTLLQQDTQWQLQVCGTEQLLALEFADKQTRSLLDIQTEQGVNGYFVDLQGTTTTAELTQASQIRVARFLRIQGEGHGCNDNAFDQLILRAQGNEPFWSLTLNNQGLLLQRPNSPPLALPYIREELPEGYMLISSQADAQQLTLWLQPQHCYDSMSGAFNHLTARLEWSGQTYQGCAHYGARQPFE